MKLLSVLSASETTTECLELNVAYLDDAGASQTVPYGWAPGDPHGLGPQIDEWMAADHPGLVVSKYQASLPTAEQNEAEKAELLKSVAAGVQRLRELGVDL